jgi:hypothetical protein
MTIRWIRTLMFGLVVLAWSATAFGQIGLMITIAPPPLPVYEQPICPGDGYIWTPGFWAYDADFDDYYWVPGTWVLAPEVGFLWTPAYWGWGGDRFVFYDGYWGPEVGFYGGIYYGFGYFGVGYEGGRWDNGRFFYNRAVNNVDVTIIHNVYNSSVSNRYTENHISYNGGEGGISARPTPQEEAAARQRHVPPVPAQTQHVQQARSNPQQRASMNRGKPEIAATPRPGEYNGRGVVPARAAGGNYTPPANRGGHGAATQPRENTGGQGQRPENNAGGRPETNSRPGNNARPDNRTAPNSYSHVRELPPAERPAPVNTGNSKQDQKYQQQQDKLYAQQQKERQKVAQQQQKEDQTIAKQNNEQAKQQTEQRHQQQTQQLQQKHQQQQQQMQQRQAPRQAAPSRKQPGK